MNQMTIEEWLAVCSKTDLVAGFKNTAIKNQIWKWSVYVHIFPDGKYYVGITKNETCQRWCKNGKGYRGQKKVYDAIKKFGWENIKHLSVRVPSSQIAHTVEGILIELFDSVENGYNVRYEPGFSSEEVEHEED